MKSNLISLSSALNIAAQLTQAITMGIVMHKDCPITGDRKPLVIPEREEVIWAVFNRMFGRLQDAGIVEGTIYEKPNEKRDN